MIDNRKDGHKTLQNSTVSQKLVFLANDSIVFGISYAISRAVAIISVFVLARYFTVKEYGVFDYFIVLSGVFAALFGLGLDSAVGRYYYEYKEKISRQQLLSQSLFIQILTCIIFCPLAWFLCTFFDILPDNEHSDELLLIVLLMMPVILTFNFSQNLLKWTFARTKFLILTLGFSFTQAAVLLSGAIIFNLSLWSLFSLILIPYGLFSILGIFFVRQWLVFPAKQLQFIRVMLPYAIPFAVISGLSAFIPIYERTVIQNYSNTYQLGIYAIATRVVLLAGLFVTAFQLAWGPFSLSLYSNKDDVLVKNTFNPILKVYVMIICSLTLLVSSLSPLIISIVASDKYLEASILVFPLIMALAIHSIGLITELGIDIAKKSYLKIYAYLANAAVIIFASLYLIPIHGVVGVSLSVLLGSIVRTLLVTYLAQRAEYMPWDFSPSILLVCITLLFGFGSMIDLNIAIVIDKSLVLALGILALQVCFWMGILTSRERNQIILMVKRGIVR